jgi:hypothetical protein
VEEFFQEAFNLNLTISYYMVPITVNS